ncbi:D-aminopeptidase [Pleomorphomonas sp. NRK KF1]|uniref:D-aminopeptidase n=1 Tax=Pleomorphomonas sp. NRK KF1 TaxID=2943000 RepID=UPI00204367B5|nr:D-aminopeptidase [Pleomorphomonas sp. NRK KF1]MCM5553154.1 D-aminopeptidase [Pleomorphomonas sp. NRK KF1]
MSSIDRAALAAAVASLPERFKGPGGTVGVMKDGEVIVREAWGYADQDAGLAMTPRRLLPICSISKQMTCGVLLDLVGDPAALDDRLGDFLPNLQGRRPTVRELCDNRSGLRDYWALTVLHGAHHEGAFRREDARPLFARMKTTHFEPGSQYSYSNGNYRILSDLLEDHSGRSLAELYRRHIFGPAGMHDARLASDTASPLNGTVGYEGSPALGWFPATNRIFWTGDAGVAATLDDMLAWEGFIDRTRNDANGLYGRLSAPTAFADGRPARYGMGLAQDRIDDVAITGHGGALRGFRIRRLYAAAERLSVVVMFNHEADAHAAALFVMRAALGRPSSPRSGAPVGEGWAGAYLEPESGLSVEVTTHGNAVLANMGGGPEVLSLGEDGVARSVGMSLSREGGGLRLERPGDNLRGMAARLAGAPSADIAGRYWSAETESVLEIEAVGPAFAGRFDGFLGRGPMHQIRPFAGDVWKLATPRGMDAPAPGDWTVQVRRAASGAVEGLTLGCWLARNVTFARLV